MFGLSRVSVWNILEKLRESGLHLEGIRNKGYRLGRDPDRLHPALIAAMLELETDNSPVGLYGAQTIDSTHSAAERLLAEGVKTPFVVIAAEQSHGRGRLGRVWHSPDAGNLYMTAVFRPDLPPGRMQRFTLWMGLRVCEWLNRIHKVPAVLKWPNDLLHSGRKLSGMLTEARIDADHMRELLFGIGINVNADTAAWPPDLASRAVSMREVAARAFELNRLAASLVATLLCAYRGFVDGSFNRNFDQLWQRYDAIGANPVGLTTRQGRIEGTVLGLADDGGLKLRLRDGSTQTFHSGDVSINSAMVDNRY